MEAQRSRFEVGTSVVASIAFLVLLAKPILMRMSLFQSLQTVALTPLLALSLLGCASNGKTNATSDASVQTVPCNPLARRSLQLTNVWGVGTDGQGTFYVADEPTGSYEPRVFVSLGDTLYARYVEGSGQSGSTHYTLSYSDADALGIPQQALLIDASSGQAAAMALAPYGTRYFIGDASGSYQSLALTDASSIGSLNVLSLPHEIAYLGAIDGAQQVLVTMPLDGSELDYRAFYGSKDNMVECEVTSVTAGGAMSAPTRTVVFKVGPATKQVVLGGQAFPAPEDAGAATNVPAAPSLDGYVFYCLND